MYKILGGDGKEYGPVSTEALRQWVNEGRANAQTQVQPEGSSNWIALGEVPEFATLFAAPSTASVPGTIGAPIAGIPGGGGNAAQLVAGPAIGLIVTAILGGLAQAASILLNLLGIGMAGAAASQGGSNGQELPAWVNMMSGGLGIVFNIIGIIMAVVVFMGAMKMKKLQSFGFVMAATIIAMVPCISPCCWVGLPIGIWALVVLNKPEVKGSFS
jgi:hypothetical protein